jgi:hypothetical protein
MDSWSNEICHFVVMMQNIPQRAIISAQLENLTNLEYFPDLLENFRKILTNLVGKFFQLANISNTEIIYTLKLLRTSMLSWLRTSAATEWLARYLFNTQSQLICIIVAQPHPEPACNDDTCQPHNTPGHALLYHSWLHSMQWVRWTFNVERAVHRTHGLSTDPTIWESVTLALRPLQSKVVGTSLNPRCVDHHVKG